MSSLTRVSPSKMNWDRRKIQWTENGTVLNLTAGPTEFGVVLFCPPAMAASLTDHVWEIEELVAFLD